MTGEFDSIYDDRIVQLHDRGIVGRMQQISGDPSADLPSGIDVGAPATPTFDIGRYQQKTRLLLRSGANGVDNYEAFWDSETELGPIRDARAFQIVGAGYRFDNLAATTQDYWTGLWLTYDTPGGEFYVSLGSGYSVINPPAHMHYIAYQNIVSQVFDNTTFNNTGVWQGDLTGLRLSRISFAFDKISGSTLRVNNVFVNVKLFF